MRRLSIVGLALLAGSLGMAGSFEPAVGATRPPQVGLVSFVRADLAQDGQTAGLRIRWKHVSPATRYQVFISRSYDKVSSAPVAVTTTRNSAWIRGLQPGRNYFVMVRALNGSTAGSRSSRVGHGTIRAQGSHSSPSYKVMTYNLCSDKCSGWSKRQPGALERIARFTPDILATQESSRLTLPPGYTSACAKSAKNLYFRTSRFALAPAEDADPAANCGTSDRTGWLPLGNGRYAVWAELADTHNDGRRIIFTSVHLSPVNSAAAGRLRNGEVKQLLAQLDELNPEGLPVVLAGDFNSNKSRTNDYEVVGPLAAAQFHDSYDLAEALVRQHFNSYNNFKVTPVTSVKWGDHVDHVWVRASSSVVTKWSQRGKFDGSNYATPIPSDHHPVLAVIRVD